MQGIQFSDVRSLHAYKNQATKILKHCFYYLITIAVVDIIYTTKFVNVLDHRPVA
jgi:hypothetical protein